MSLATRCPACGTIFRVVQDQLKVSEGWVRCGQCHEVFHGIEALFDLDSDPSVAARRAIGRAPATAPATRAFADQRASAPIPMPMPMPGAPAASPIAIPGRPEIHPPPVTGPSLFGPSDPPPSTSAARPGYTGFTPASRALPPADPAPWAPPPQAVAVPTPPAPNSFAPVATRGTIAPRFAARLAEEAARAQAVTPSPIPPAFPPPAASSSSPFGSALQLPRVHGWQPSFAPEEALAPAPTSEPEPEQASPPMYIPPSLLARRPVDSAPRVEAYEQAAVQAHWQAPWPGAVQASWHVPVQASEQPAEPEYAPSAADASAADLASDFASGPPDDEDRAGPPTLASMLPEDAGDWPPRRTRKKRGDAGTPGTELALVDRSRDPRFLREARSGARWRRPWVRAVLSIALLLLVAAAVGQVAWPQRDTLAARWPATLPAWQWLCQQADCRIEAPRAIASLALDGSSLTRTDTEHVLLFAADLRNRADHAVRMPSFDVTFMDLNGEIVSRKVLTPEQLGIHRDALPPEGELHVHARLQVGTLAASGFQADLFYP